MLPFCMISVKATDHERKGKEIYLSVKIYQGRWKLFRLVSKWVTLNSILSLWCSATGNVSPYTILFISSFSLYIFIHAILQYQCLTFHFLASQIVYWPAFCLQSPKLRFYVLSVVLVHWLRMLPICILQCISFLGKRLIVWGRWKVQNWLHSIPYSLSGALPYRQCQSLYNPLHGFYLYIFIHAILQCSTSWPPKWSIV